MRAGTFAACTLLFTFGQQSPAPTPSPTAQAPQQQAEGVNRPAAATAASRPETSGALYRANARRTGVYNTRGVQRLTEAVAVSPRLFKIETSKVTWWGDWYDVGGGSFYAGGEFSVPTGITFSAPVYADGTVYFKIDSSRDGQSVVYAVDAEAGRLRWELPIKRGIASSPTVADGTLYLGGGDVFYALDPVAKKVKWSWTSKDAEQVVTSPLVVGGAVFFGTDLGVFRALDAKTGAALWEYDAHGDRICEAPAISGDTVYLCDNQGVLYALEAKTGRERWQHFAREGVSSLAVEGDSIYFRDYENHVRALDARTGERRAGFKLGERAGTNLAVLGKTVYFGGQRNWAVTAYDADTQRKRWEHVADGRSSAPIIVEGVLYFTCSDKRLYALDAATGTRLWTTKHFKSSLSAPVAADGRIYFLGEDGHLNVAR